MIRIVLVEDQQILRDSLASSLNETPNYEVVVSLSESDLLVETCRLYHPDLVIMDVYGVGENGIEATARLKETFPSIKVILFTGMMDIGFIENAKIAGADSFVYKNISMENLLNIIQSTLDGYSLFPSEKDILFPNDSILTEKEITILRLVCMEMSRKEIAKELNMSEHTIRNYINRILDKTGYDSIARLAIFSISHGYITPNKN